MFALGFVVGVAVTILFVILGALWAVLSAGPVEPPLALSVLDSHDVEIRALRRSTRGTHFDGGIVNVIRIDGEQDAP